MVITGPILGSVITDARANFTHHEQTIHILHADVRVMSRRCQNRSAMSLCAVALVAIACHREPRKSQPAYVEQHLGSPTIAIRYNRPSARGRVLFGGIVPYGAVWCPGADEATTFATSRQITFAGQRLAPGTYSVWAIPAQDKWTLILSRKAHVFHIPYPAGHDALRVTIAPTTGPFDETLAFEFPVAESDHAILALRWGTTVIPIPIATWQPSSSS
jgi:hypothetical protein